MLMRTAAVELGPLGITVNSVAPGAVAVRATAATPAHPDAVSELAKVIPLGHVGRPEDVAGVVAVLASDDAASITGSTYDVDGGMIRHFTDSEWRALLPHVRDGAFLAPCYPSAPGHDGAAAEGKGRGCRRWTARSSPT